MYSYSSKCLLFAYDIYNKVIQKWLEMKKLARRAFWAMLGGEKCYEEMFTKWIYENKLY